MMLAPRALLTVAVAASIWQIHPSALAFTSRGVGTAALIGGDLTDPDNNGDPENDIGYDAIFAASEEPFFAGGEGAFNVFDNQVGGGNMKWCCGDQNNFPANPISIDATFPAPVRLSTFTLTSGNDTPAREPRVFQIQGSIDGTTFVPIYTRTDASSSPWTQLNEVLQFDAGTDFPVQTTGYTTLRFITTATNATTGARFQLAEIEYFAIPEPTSGALLVLGLASALFGRRKGHR